MLQYFYLAILQLTSAKFQSFAYSQKAVESSFVKFVQQFEIINTVLVSSDGGTILKAGRAQSLFSFFTYSA